MAPKPMKVSVLLNGGMDNRTEDEFVQPVLVQGAPPKLKRSVNTRFGARGGSVTRSPRFTALAIPSFQARVPGSPRYAAMSSASAKSTLLLKPPGGPQGGDVVLDGGRTLINVAAGSEVDGLNVGTFSNSGQASATAISIARAGTLGTTRPSSDIATAHNELTGEVWQAFWASNEIGGLYTYPVYSCRDAAGVLLAGPNLGAVGSGEVRPEWMGLTAHGARGVRAWIHNGVTTIAHSSLVRQARVCVLESYADFLTVPSSANVGSNPIYGIDVCDGGDDYAYIISADSATPANAILRRINITNPTTPTVAASVTLTGALLGGGKVSVSSQVVRGVRYVVACASSVTNGTTTLAAYSDALAPLWSPVTTPGNGNVSAGFLDLNVPINLALLSTPFAVYIVSPAAGSFAAGSGLVVDPPVRMIVLAKPLTAAGSITTIDTLSYRALQSHIAHWSPVAGCTIPVFGVVRCYGTTLTESGEADYVDDPAIVYYMAGYPFAKAGITPLARVGVLRGVRSPARIQAAPYLGSKSLVIHGQRGFLAYRQSDLSLYGLMRGAGGQGRYVELDLAPRSHSVAQDRDGSALLAAALPLIWDGGEITDLSGHLWSPRIAFGPSTTAGVRTAGAYSFRAVFQWVDRAGNLRRSRPSNTITMTSDGVSPVRPIFVTPADGWMKGSVLRPQILLYSTAGVAGKSYHLMAVSQNDTFPLFIATDVTEERPQLYTGESDGEERAPQPPPPAHDISVIGPRCWVLDAEERARWAYSKLRIAGIGYEFHPSFEVIMPSGAGDGMAAREWGGVPLFLCERGVYTVSNEGPLNTGVGGSYSTPVKMSDLGCSNTASVVLYPGGMMWQQGDRFVQLDGQGVRLVPDFFCSHDVSVAVCWTRTSELLFFSATLPEVRVFHYDTGKWSVWDSETMPETVEQASLLPWDRDVVVTYSQASGTTRRLHSQTFSAAPHMGFETDWLLLGGDFQDHVLLQDVILSASVAGPHGVEIELLTDYETTRSMPLYSRTAAQIATTAGTVGRYTLRVEPQRENCRAVKVRVRDVVDPAGGNTQGMSPRSLTIGYTIDGMYFEEVFNELNSI